MLRSTGTVLVGPEVRVEDKEDIDATEETYYMPKMTRQTALLMEKRKSTRLAKKRKTAM